MTWVKAHQFSGKCAWLNLGAARSIVHVIEDDGAIRCRAIAMATNSKPSKRNEPLPSPGAAFFLDLRPCFPFRPRNTRQSYCSSR
jgi:hypothetical protein